MSRPPPQHQLRRQQHRELCRLLPPGPRRKRRRDAAPLAAGPLRSAGAAPWSARRPAPGTVRCWWGCAGGEGVGSGGGRSTHIRCSPTAAHTLIDRCLPRQAKPAKPSSHRRHWRPPSPTTVPSTLSPTTPAAIAHTASTHPPASQHPPEVHEGLQDAHGAGHQREVRGVAVRQQRQQRRHQARIRQRRGACHECLSVCGGVGMGGRARQGKWLVGG